MKLRILLMVSVMLNTRLAMGADQAEAPLAAGGFETVAVTADGRVVEWGEWGGRLPYIVSGLDHVKAISAGFHHVLAIKDDGTVWAWGDNDHGQLGDGTGIRNDRPVQVRDLTGAVAIAAGAFHSYALKNDGTIWGWGDNRNGQLGDGSTTDRRLPVVVAGFLNVKAIAAGTTHLVALRRDGSVCTWGLKDNGQVVDAALIRQPEPFCLSGFSDVAQIAAGGNATYALRQDGTVSAWGMTPCRKDATLAIWDEILIDRAKSIAAGTNHLMIKRDDGSLWACGIGADGQLGYGGTDNQARPLQVGGGLFHIDSIAAGFRHSAARTSDGSVWTWGDNSQGQLGSGDTTPRSIPGTVWDGTGALRQ